MAKPSTEFQCQACGATTSNWSGRCQNCAEWNSIVEIDLSHKAPGGLKTARGKTLTLSALSDGEDKIIRKKVNFEEFDRVLGGGLVKGSAILLGGDPGIGKSTILLQIGAQISQNGQKAIYISGEEAASQIRLRAERLEVQNAPLQLAAATNLRNILETLKAEKPDFVIIDSIQTLWSDNIQSPPGTVSQVRAVVHELVSFAKLNDIAVVLVGHVTKDGQIAGPRTVEHMVDTVLYFEGERGYNYRLLRAVKNRFGPAGEIGVFEMTSLGLKGVANPSALFLSDRESKSAGSAVFAGMEGSRPLLMEVQALIAPSPYGTPRRAVIGWDQARLNMILAVLEARASVDFGPSDIYLNIAGGLKISEPAADLAVAAALISAHQDRPLPQNAVFFGEISLSGSLRAAPFADARLKEAEKLGFAKAILPKQTKLNEKSPLALTYIPRLEEFVEIAHGKG